MKKLRNLLNTILRGLAGISFLAMVVLTCWQVFTRYILKSPSTWSEELVSYLFAWASLMGAAIVTSERGHMNIPILVERCSKSGQKVLNFLGRYPGIRRNPDFHSGYGTDDFFLRNSHWYFLHCTSPVRHFKYDLYGYEYS